MELMVTLLIAVLVCFIHGRSLEYKRYLKFIGIDPADLHGLSRKEKDMLIRERHLETKEQLNLRNDISEIGIEILDPKRYQEELNKVAEKQEALINWEHKFPLQEAA